MSSEDESHSVSHISGAGESSPSSSEQSSDRGVRARKPTRGRGGRRGRSGRTVVPVRGTSRRGRGAGRDALPSRGRGLSVSGDVSTSASCLSEAELREISGKYGFPEGFQLQLPGAEERVNSDPTNRLALYEEHLRAGLRLPLHPFIANLLDYYQVVPGQLTPNSFRNIIGFVIVCNFLKINPRASLFRVFFVIRHRPGDGGWWFIGPRHGRSLFEGIPSSIHGWKNRFFFISSDRPWGSRWAWKQPREGPNRNAQVSPEDEGDYFLICGMEIPRIQELITEQNLYDAELSPIASLGMKKFSADAARAALAREAARPAKRKEGPASTPGVKAAVAKRPCTGISIGASAPVAKTVTQAAGHPRASVAPPVDKQPVDKGKQVATATTRSSSDRSSRPPTPVASGNARSTSAVAGTARAAHSPGGDRSPRVGPPGRVSVVRRREGRTQIHQAKFDIQESALANATVAREIMKMVLLPRDVEEREKVSVGDVLEEVFPHLAHLVHDVAAMRAAVTRYADMSTSLQNNVKEAEERIAGSDRRLHQLAASESELKKEVAKLREESSTLRAESTTLREESSKLREESSALREIYGGLQSSVTEKETELVKLRRLVADHAAENEGLQRLREVAEERARAAEERAISAENSRSHEIATAVSLAVSEYKNSAEFEQDASDACLDFYKFGYSDCVAKAVDAFPGIDVAKIALPMVGKEGEHPDANVGEETVAQSDATEPIIIESPERAPAEG